ncbi:MAG: hypothetical protein IJU19_09080 [Bacteroidales bacterium]|nr:hypothetical protein [Bacteroidales bacterium]
MKKVLISDATHEVLPRRLREAGFEVNVVPGLDYAGLLQAVQGCEGLVVRSKVAIDRAFIDAAPSLRCIGRVGAGMETIDTDYATRRGIRCLNSPEGNRDAVGEHAVGLLLALLDRIAVADREVRQGLWRREANRGRELGSLTVGIIGLGNMGQAFARRLSGFGCRVVAYDKYKPQGEAVAGVERVSLAELQAVADVVSFHVPLTAETHHYLCADFVHHMQKPFYVVNTARGAVVDTEALVKAMQSGQVLGAALDVLEYEEMQADGLGRGSEALDYLRQSEQAVLTPHVAGWTVESKYRLAAVLADKMVEALR